MLETLIRSLQLAPHPEGGWYRESYRAPVLVEVHGKQRAASTAIYFLLGSSDFSALHRIAADEVWHFYEGADLEIASLDETGVLRRERLGRDPATGAVPQLVVPAGRWFGARLAAPTEPGRFALVGCTVAPGFDFADFELADRTVLLQRFPEHAELICAWTRG